MKSLKECLLNEVRLTIHNTKVANHKALKDVKAGDTVYLAWVNGANLRDKSGRITNKDTADGTVFLDNDLAIKMINNELLIPIEGSIDSEFIVWKTKTIKTIFIFSTDENEFKRLVKKYAK